MDARLANGPKQFSLSKRPKLLEYGWTHGLLVNPHGINPATTNVERC